MGFWALLLYLTLDVLRGSNPGTECHGAGALHGRRTPAAQILTG